MKINTQRQRVEVRRNEILSLISRLKEVKVSDLRQRFGVSEGTIRMDLRRLEEEGYLQRVYGGAIGTQKILLRPKATPFELRMQRFELEKRAIAHYTVSNFIYDGDVLLIDASTTTTLLIREIVRCSRDVTIITNAVNFCNEIVDSTGINLIIAGGELQKTNFSLVGEATNEFLDKLQVDKAFLGTTSVLFNEGLMTVTTGEAEVKKRMIKAAKEVYILATHGKIGRRLDLVPFSNFGRENGLLKIYPYNLASEGKSFKIITDDNFENEGERVAFEEERKKFLPFNGVFDIVHLTSERKEGD